MTCPKCFEKKQDCTCNVITKLKDIPGDFLPENPTRFDYLHAIRAVASRRGDSQIFNLADKGMHCKEQ